MRVRNGGVLWEMLARLVPDWDLKMSPLVPWPWRQRILMLSDQFGLNPANQGNEKPR
jgi:hypothetical protein